MKIFHRTIYNQNKIIFVLWLGLLLSMLPLSASAFSIENRPQTLTQPDGKVLHVFASGDTYYHWLHDANNFTIVMDKNGYYVYAKVENGMLVPTTLKVGESDPASAGLSPGLNYDEKNIEKIRNEHGANIINPSFVGGIKEERARLNPNAKFGATTMNPIVIFIRFKSETEFSTAKSVFNDDFNSNTNPSLKGYYLWNSYNTLTITSNMLGGTASTIVSYQDSHSRSYFQEKSASNPNGYDNTNKGDREDKLWEDATNAMKSKVPAALDLDENNDGKIDMIYFVIKGSEDGWGDILWPHKGSFSSSTVINGATPKSFMCVFETWHDVGLLSHETGHVLGAPDLYRYNKPAKITPLGGWDCMASQNSIPQSMSAYTKWKYMGFINSIPEIKESGWYSLKPLGEDDNAYKIRSSEPDEFFVVEYRKKAASSYESMIPGSGLVIYRINTTITGNSKGYPDEIYVYRSGGIDSVTNGSLSNAFFSLESGRTEFTDQTSPNAWMTNGSLGHLNITNIGSAGNTIKFYYDRNCTNPTTVSTVTYTSLSTIPSFTATTSSIKTSGAITFAANSNKTFESKLIQLKPGFTASANSNFHATGFVCTFEKLPTVARVMSQIAVTVDPDQSLIDVDANNEGLNFTPYPNPTVGDVFLTSGQKLEGGASVTVFSNDGRIIQKLPVPSDLNNMVINLNGQPSGLYHIHVVSGDQSSTRTVMVK